MHMNVYYDGKMQALILFIYDSRKRHEGAIKDLEKKQESQREALSKLQQQLQQQQVKAAARS